MEEFCQKKKTDYKAEEARGRKDPCPDGQGLSAETGSGYRTQRSKEKISKKMMILNKLFLISILVFLFLSVSVFADSTLISWWKFDNDVLDTQLLNNGTRYNFTNGYVAGKYGNALEFDSAAEQFVDIGDDSSLNFGTDDFSIEAWIKTSGLEATAMSIIAKYESAEGFDLSMDSIFILFATDGESLAIPNLIYDDEWHHIVAVRNGYDVLFYIDGSLNYSESMGSIDDVSTIANLTIGSRDIYGFFDGVIDNVRIWSGALNETEVENLFLYNALEPCEEDVCIGVDLYECENGMLVFDETCEYCCVEGECLSEEECEEPECEGEETTCIDDDQYICVEGFFEFNQTCTYGCLNGLCRSKPSRLECIGDTSGLITIFSIMFVGVLLFSLFAGMIKADASFIETLIVYLIIFLVIIACLIILKCI